MTEYITSIRVEIDDTKVDVIRGPAALRDFALECARSAHRLASDHRTKSDLLQTIAWLENLQL